MPHTEMSPLLRLKNVCRHYGTGRAMVKALDQATLNIWPGEFVAIMGTSGSGKSTLMNVLGCLDRPTSGQYFVQDQDVSQLSRDGLAALRRDMFGFIFQRYNLLNAGTITENVELPAIYAGVDKPSRHKRAQELLKNLGLSERLETHPSKLSGGQQQRVAIARALMNNPPIILADEPTGALDTKTSQEVMTLLKQLNEEGRTIILITHEEDVAAHASRQIRIQDGHILSDSHPKGVSQQKPQPRQRHHGSDFKAEVIESIKTALRSLKSNPFRAWLTLLGIVIGVSAVITMLAVGNGSKQSVMDQISSMGTNLLDIRPGAPGIRSSGDMATLVPADAKAISEIMNVDAVVPVRRSNKTLRYGNIDDDSTIQGVGFQYPQARNWDIKDGSFFSQSDVENYAAVAIIGTTVKENLFKNDNPINKFILIGNIPFQIIGIMKEKGASPWGGDQDDVVFVPYTTAMGRLFGGQYLNSITVHVKNVQNIEATEQEIETLLTNRHGKVDFSVRNTASFLEMATSTQNTLTILLGAVAAISLLVGGIGVMNIMLVSVVERTREIGIRMATGARVKDIMMQFITEAAVVCIMGGLIGIAFGFTAGFILSLFGVAIVFTTMPVILAFSCSVATGIIFGYLPAKQAAHLDPVMALTSE